MKFLKLLNSLFTRRDRQLLAVLVLLSIVVSILETCSITAIMVFISVSTNFEMITQNYYCSWLYHTIGCSSPSQFIILFGSVLIFFYLVRGILNIIHIYLMGHFSYTRYHRFSTLMFSRFLRFSYADFVGKNSAMLSQSIFSYTGMLTQLIFGLLTLSAECFTVLCVYAMLFYVNWKMTLILSCFLSLKAFVLIKIFSRSIAQAGKRTHAYSLASAKIFNESMGNFKLIKLGGFEKKTAERVSTSTSGFSSAQIVFITLQNTPRFLLETVGFVLLVAIMLYVIYRYNNASFVIPIVSLYALAFYRLLPSLNKILASVNQITFSYHALQGVCDFLQLPTETLESTPVLFNRSITLNNVSFEYQKNKSILKNVSLNINKGERVAFIGPSGSGKSTLIDLIMGLYEPQEGTLEIDDVLITSDHRKAWRKMIGYIPQSIYLFDGTVKDNVVFGRPYNEANVISVLKKAQMYDFLQTQQGLDTLVGEGGIKLSGGQKQRIAIARALYGDPELLVLDEATSALDHETESSIMDQIYQLDSKITLIIIAHRTSTIARCDRIFRIDNGMLYQTQKDSLVSLSKNNQVNDQLTQS